MKNPNGYGSVTKLSGNRRKPFWVKKTAGFNEKGHPIYKTIGYTATREEGLMLLADYNKDPWDIDQAGMTLKELFELYCEKKLPKMSTSSQNSARFSYKYLSEIETMKYKEIKSAHMQDIIDNCGKGYSTQGAIKTLWTNLDKFAMELDLISKTYSQLLTAESVPETTRSRFTDDEINKLWNLYENPTADDTVQDMIELTLILIYSGFRISEFLTLSRLSVNLLEGIFQGGIKTQAGKNRIVPIHSLIRPMVERRLEDNMFIASNGKGGAMPYITFNKRWARMTEFLGINKVTHETRHTFESLLDSAGANRRCIDLMMGHKSKDVGNRVYNHKTIEELKTNIELVTR